MKTKLASAALLFSILLFNSPSKLRADNPNIVPPQPVKREVKILVAGEYQGGVIGIYLYSSSTNDVTIDFHNLAASLANCLTAGYSIQSHESLIYTLTKP